MLVDFYLLRFDYENVKALFVFIPFVTLFIISIHIKPYFLDTYPQYSLLPQNKIVYALWHVVCFILKFPML